MKLLDYIIVALIIGCMFVGYSGHRFIAVLLLILVAILASWRFWHRRRERDMARTGASGELDPGKDHVNHDSAGDVGCDD